MSIAITRFERAYSWALTTTRHRLVVVSSGLIKVSAVIWAVCSRVHVLMHHVILTARPIVG